MGTLHEDQYILLILSRSLLLRMRNASLHTSCSEKQNTFLCSKKKFPKIVPLMRQRVEEYDTASQDTDDNITKRMRTACWKPKPTGTHSQYVMRIAFPLHQCLHERPSILCLYRNVSLVFTLL